MCLGDFCHILGVDGEMERIEPDLEEVLGSKTEVQRSALEDCLTRLDVPLRQNPGKCSTIYEGRAAQ